jgi:hypothetical protein
VFVIKSGTLQLLLNQVFIAGTGRTEFRLCHVFAEITQKRQNRNSVPPDIKNPRQILNLTGIEDKADFISGIPVLLVPEEISLKRTHCFFLNNEYL